MSSEMLLLAQSLRTIRQNHGLQHSFPTDRSLRADASESAAMPLPSHRPTPFCLILAEAVLLTPQASAFLPAFLKICHCEEPARDCGLAATWQSQGLPLNRLLVNPLNPKIVSKTYVIPNERCRQCAGARRKLRHFVVRRC